MTNETKFLVAVGGLTLAVIVGAIVFLSQPGSSPQTLSKVDPKLLIKEGSQEKNASSSAKVAIVEFSDFECPACATAAPIVKQVVNDYQGKVSLIFRHFPLPQHANAKIAAQAAEAAGEQGKFWEMEDKLFSNQNDWDSLGNPLDKFITYAQELNLDTAKLKQEIESQKFTDKINSDLADGNALGINSTPTFYIAKRNPDNTLTDAQKLEGSFAPEAFKILIDQKLQ